MLVSRSGVLIVACLSLCAGAIAGTSPGVRPPLHAAPPQALGGQRGAPAAPASGNALLAGQVVEHPSGRGVAGATVMLRSGGRGNPPGIGRGDANPWIVGADSRGRFYFGNLAAGSYTLQVTAAGYADVAPSAAMRAYEIRAGEPVTDVRVRLTPRASLSGTIRDDAGDPIVGATVVAFRRAVVNGQRTLARASTARTDDRGSYRFASLVPSEYVVCACGVDPIPFDTMLLTTLAAEPMHLLGLAARAITLGADAAVLDDTLQTFPLTFHPNSRTISQATRIALLPGEDRRAVDVHVTPARSTRVSGTVTGAVGLFNAAFIRLVPAAEGDAIAVVTSLAPALVQADGRFDFAGVPPGAYVLRISHTPNDGRGGGPSGAALVFLGARATQAGPPAARAIPGESPQWAAEPVTVGDAGVRGWNVALRRGASISGRVEFVGAAPPPAPEALARMLIFSRPMEPDGSGVGSPIGGPIGAGGPIAGGPINPDATFTLRGAPPGRHALATSLLPGWPTLKSILVGGADVTDLPFEIGTTDIADVVVTFSDAPMARLRGTMPGASAAAPMTALVFPADRRYWTAPVAGLRRFRNVPISRAGSFEIAGVPAGEYFVVVVPDEDANEWQVVDQLERLSKTARRVAVPDRGTMTIEVGR